MKMSVTYLALCVAFLYATSGSVFPVNLDSLKDAKVVRVNFIHQINCEAYNYLDGVRAEAVLRGHPDPVPVLPELNDYVRQRCQMMNPEAEHSALREDFRFNLYNSRTGSLVSANRLVISSEHSARKVKRASSACVTPPRDLCPLRATRVKVLRPTKKVFQRIQSAYLR